MKKPRTTIKTKSISRPISAKQQARKWEKRMAKRGSFNPYMGRMRFLRGAAAAGFQIEVETGGEEYIGLESGDDLLKEDAT